MAVQEAAALTDAGEQARCPRTSDAGGRGWVAEHHFYSCEECVCALDLEYLAMAWTLSLWSSHLGKVAVAQQLELPFLAPTHEPDVWSSLSLIPCPIFPPSFAAADLCHCHCYAAQCF
ncbi:hypothetical protein ZWY2020_039239 [Hordeum vulgare]|nr:hypothetical protein ZWY2020_039239 [Hordeum vulgare]